MTNASKKDKTTGEIVSIMAEDCDRLINESNIMFFLFTSPIQVRAPATKRHVRNINYAVYNFGTERKRMIINLCTGKSTIKQETHVRNMNYTFYYIGRRRKRIILISV